MNKFKDNVAVITGASSGIGRALSERCAQEGMKVVIADLDKKALAKTEKDLKATGASILAVTTDFSKPGDLEALAKKTIDKFGAVHLLCNAVGVHSTKPLTETTLADWQWVIGVNLNGTIYALEAFLPIMFKQDTECHIVNISSVLGGICALPFNGPYNVSQFGLITLFETLHHELSAMHPKIKVSVICPDYADTGILESERHCPAELRNAPAKGKAGEANLNFEKIKDIIQATVQAETPVEELADMVFHAIKEEKFYNFPHPTSKVIIADRLARIMDQRNPDNILKLMGVVS